VADSVSIEEECSSCHTPLGWVRVHVEEERIRRVIITQEAPSSDVRESLVGRQACDAIQEWLAGGAWPEGLPLAPQGTPFQQRVWQRLQQIPPGRRVTYGELAEELGTGARAVGGACRANAIPLLIPCHRVVAANGDGGFAGHTRGRWLEIKRWLLQHE